MFYYKEYFELDPDKKDLIWADRLVTHFRQHWQPLVDHKRAEDGMSIVLSVQNLENVLSMFKDPSKVMKEFLPIAIFEKVRNILIGESSKAGITVNLNAVDPLSEGQRKKDKQLLESRAEVESLISYLNRSLGLPEYKMKDDPEVPMHGDISKFDSLGLNPMDPTHVEYYFQVWHRLQHEADAQAIVNHFKNVNEVNQHIDQWINDVLAKKAVAMQCYVDEMSGMYKMKYLRPESVWHIPGSRKDGNDDICKGYQEIVSVGEFLKRVGGDFDLEGNIDWLINSVNAYNHRSFTGVFDGMAQRMYGTGGIGTEFVCHYSDFMNFHVNIGYIEWKTWNASVAKVTDKNFHGNPSYHKKHAGYNPTEDSGYQKIARYYQTTYRAYYVSTSSVSQVLYKFGLLYHQAIEGQEDEYSSFSIMTQVKEGKTAAEIAAPWIEAAQEMFIKMRWMIRAAKPKGRAYNYDSLIALANKMIKEGDPVTKIKTVISMFTDGVNEIYKTPTINGEKIGGGINPNFDLPNGIDATTFSFRELIDWAVDKIRDDLGVNNVRTAYNPRPNEAFSLQMKTMEASQNATDYIPSMLDSLNRSAAKHCLLTQQDVVRFKDTLPYRYLVSVFGDAAIERIRGLEKIALHRYDIFVESTVGYNNRMKIHQDTEIAWQNKEIGYDVKLIIDSIDDYRKAAQVLAFEKRRAEQDLREREQAQRDHEMQIAQINSQTRLEELNIKGQWDNERENTRGQWLFRVKELELKAEGQLKREIMANERDKQDARAEGKIKEIAAKTSIENQQPLR